MQCLLNSNVKVIQQRHVHIVYFWDYVAVIYFLHIFISLHLLLIQLVPIFTYVQ